MSFKIVWPLAAMMLAIPILGSPLANADSHHGCHMRLDNEGGGYDYYLCLDFHPAGPVQEYVPILNDLEVPLVQYGVGTIDFCVEICFSNIPAPMVSALNTDACLPYAAITLTGGSCDADEMEPMRLKQAGEEALVCLQPGTATFTIEPDEQNPDSPGISNVPWFMQVECIA